MTLKPVAAGLVGTIVFAALLGLGALIVLMTHVSTIGNVLGLFGVVAGAFTAARLAAGPIERRGYAGLVPVLVAVVAALALGAGVVYGIGVVLAGLLGIVLALQGAPIDD